MLKLAMLSLTLTWSAVSFSATCFKNHKNAQEFLYNAEVRKNSAFSGVRALNYLVEKKVIPKDFCLTVHEERMLMLKVGTQYKYALEIYKQMGPACGYKKYDEHSSEIIEFTRKNLNRTHQGMQQLDQIAQAYCHATTNLADTLIED